MQSQTGRRPVFLVVEDEEIIRMSAVQMVEDAGFIAIEASNADEAIAILQFRNDIGVVFTDVHMPGSIDGVKLASAVRDSWPPIGLIVTSGLVRLDSESLPARGVFLTKPYRQEDLVEALHSFSG